MFILALILLDSNMCLSLESNFGQKNDKPNAFIKRSLLKLHGSPNGPYFFLNGSLSVLYFHTKGPYK